MPSRTQQITHRFGGGLASDLGVLFDGGPEGGELVIPFLLQADNVEFDLDGGPIKIGGIDLMHDDVIGGSTHTATIADNGSSFARITLTAGTHTLRVGSGCHITATLNDRSYERPGTVTGVTSNTVFDTDIPFTETDTIQVKVVTHPIRGMYDYWRRSLSGNGQQLLLAHSNGRFMVSADTSGSYIIMETGLAEESFIPTYAQLDDKVVMTNDKDHPRVFDGSTVHEVMVVGITSIEDHDSLVPGASLFTVDRPHGLTAADPADTVRLKNAGTYTGTHTVVATPTDFTVALDVEFTTDTTGDMVLLEIDFDIVERHGNRIWAARDSTLYWSSLENPREWRAVSHDDNPTGPAPPATRDGSGTTGILVEPADGDKITGIASHRGQLFIFKGPNKQSIHRFTGTPSTGSLATNLIEGISAVSQSMIFRFGNDIGFMTPNGSVHSLNTTDAFGDYNESSLSRPIQKIFRSRLRRSRLRFGQAVNYQRKSQVLFSVPVDSSVHNNTIFCMDYRFNPPRWSEWPAIKVDCLAEVTEQQRGGRISIYGGRHDGLIARLDREDRSLRLDVRSDSFYTEAINGKVKTPFLSYGTSLTEKVLEVASLNLEPKGNYSTTFGWTRDMGTQATTTVTQGGRALLQGTEFNIIDIIDSAADPGNDVTIELDAAHGLTANGELVVISRTAETTNGTRDDKYDTQATVRKFDTSTTSFDIDGDFATDGERGGIVSLTNQQFSIASAVTAESGAATEFTCSTLHRATVGSYVSIRAASDSSYDGVWEVTAVANTLDFTALVPWSGSSSTGVGVISEVGKEIFRLDTTALAERRAQPRTMTLIEGGTFRVIQYEVSNAGDFQQMDIRSLTAKIKPTSESMENI